MRCDGRASPNCRAHRCRSPTSTRFSPRARASPISARRTIPPARSSTRDRIERVVREARWHRDHRRGLRRVRGRLVNRSRRESDRVLVIRTLSKAFGLAGLRVGYAVGQPAMVKEVEKSRGPYKVNAIAERVALTALQHDRAWVDEHVLLAVELRERLADALRAMGLTPMPSAANFVCVPMAGPWRSGKPCAPAGSRHDRFPHCRMWVMRCASASGHGRCSSDCSTHSARPRRRANRGR